MRNDLVKEEVYRGAKISIYRLSTGFGNYLSAFVGGTEVRKGPMLSVEQAVELAKAYIDEINREAE